LAAFDVLDPTVVDNVSDGASLIGVGVEHLKKHAPQSWWLDHDVKRFDKGVIGLGDDGPLGVSVLLIPFLPPADEQRVVGTTAVADVGLRPDGPAKYEVEHDNGRAPDVYAARVIITSLLEHLGSHVRRAAADAGRAAAYFSHVLAALTSGLPQPRVGTREHLRDAKVCDLESAVAGKKQVLELDIAMCDAIGVKVVDAADELLEETQAVLFPVLALEVAVLHHAEQVALCAVLHYVIPPTVIDAQPYRRDDVGVIQTLGESEFGFDLLFVVFLALGATFTAEFLDCDKLGGAAFPRHRLDLGMAALAKSLAVATENLVMLVLEFRQQVGHIYHEVVWQTQAHAASLEPGAGLCRHLPDFPRHLRDANLPIRTSRDRGGFLVGVIKTARAPSELELVSPLGDMRPRAEKARRCAWLLFEGFRIGQCQF